MDASSSSPDFNMTTEPKAVPETKAIKKELTARSAGVVFAGFTIMLITVGTSMSMATILGARLARQGASPALGQWLFSVQSACWCFTSLFAEPLGRKIFHQLVVAIGCGFCGFGVTLSAPLYDPNLLFLTISILYGIGGGLCTACCYQMNAMYFKRYLGLANGLMLIGATLGVAIISTIADMIQRELGFVWALVIIGFFPIISQLASFLYVPMEESLTKPPTTSNESPQEIEEEVEQSTIMIAFAAGGSTNIGTVISSYPGTDPRKIAPTGSIWEFIKTYYMPDALCHRGIIAYSFITSVTIVTMLNIYTGSIYMLRETGYSAADGVKFLWTTEICDLFTRLTVSLICDLEFFNRGAGLQILYSCGQVIFMITPIMSILLRDYYAMIYVSAVFYGIGMGTLYVLDILLLVRCAGRENFQSAFGTSMVVRGMSFLCIGPIGGLIRQGTGDFLATYIFYCVIMTAPFFVLIETVMLSQRN